MIEKIIRTKKGLWMFIMYVLFASGILLEILLALPPVWLLNRIFGFNPDRLQAVHRLLFAGWLGFLKLGGLIRSLPAKGRPLDSPCVIISNHPGLFDVLFLIKDIPQLSVLVKRDLVRFLPLQTIFRLSGYIVSSSGNESPIDPLQQAIDTIRRGNKFLLFPEGTRSPKGGLLAFKAGAFKIARRAGVPIQPVLIRNTPPFLPHEDSWYYPLRETSVFKMEFLDPLQPPEEGEERQAALKLEKQFRSALGLERRAIPADSLEPVPG